MIIKDGVFDAESTNEQVYNESTKKIIQHSFQGFNCKFSFLYKHV